MRSKINRSCALVCLCVISPPTLLKADKQAVPFYAQNVVLQTYADKHSVAYRLQYKFVQAFREILKLHDEVSLEPMNGVVSQNELLDAVSLNAIDGFFTKLSGLKALPSLSPAQYKYKNWQSDIAFYDFFDSSAVEMWLENQLAHKDTYPLGVYLCDHNIILSKSSSSQAISRHLFKDAFTRSASLKEVVELRSSADTLIVDKTEENSEKKAIWGLMISVDSLNQVIDSSSFIELTMSNAIQSVCLFGLNKEGWSSLSDVQQEKLKAAFKKYNREYYDAITVHTASLVRKFKRVPRLRQRAMNTFEKEYFTLNPIKNKQQTKTSMNHFEALVNEYATSNGGWVW